MSLPPAPPRLLGFQNMPRLRTRPRALLVDAGDTLVFLDTLALSEVLAASGSHVAAGRLQAAVPHAKRRYEARLREGLSHEEGWSHLMTQVLLHAGAEPSNADALVGAVRRAHMRLNLWRTVPPELPRALQRARDAGFRLGVISNSEGHLEALLHHVGLRSHFELVIDSAHAGVRKPDPEIFRRALQRLDIPASDALYAGDLPDVDVRGAEAVGMQGVLVDPWNRFEALQGVWRVHSVAELVGSLLQ